MDMHGLIPIAAILAGAVVLVIVLRRFMRPHLRGEPGPPRETMRGTPPRAAPLTRAEQEYLDSSHIITGPSAGRQDPRH